MDPLTLLDCNMREAKVLNDVVAVLVNVSSVEKLLGGGKTSHVVRITAICASCHSDLTLMLGPNDVCLCGHPLQRPANAPITAVFTGQLDELDFDEYFSAWTNPFDGVLLSLDLRVLVLEWKR